MPSPINMPQQTDTMTEGTVVKWHKKEGDKIKAGEVIADIETDKATMELEAGDGGILAAIIVQAGSKTPVGAPLGWIAIGSENPADVKKQVTGGARPSSPATTQGAAVKMEVTKVGAAAGASAHTFANASMGEVHESADAGHGATREKPTPVPPLPAGNGNGAGNGDRQLASPLARRIAIDKGIDLSQLRGTGPGGRIIQRDVLGFTPTVAPAGGEKSAAAAPALAARVARGQKEFVEHSKMRSVIGKSLQKSKQTIPHFYVSVDVDVEELSAVRARMNELLKSENIKLSISDFIVKATAAALLKHPAVNAHYSDEGITRFGDVNIGIAVAVPDGLIVPVLRGVDQMGLKEIRIRSDEMIKRTRAGKQKKEDLGPGTFTISNLGAFGVREFSAIINPPEVAILAVSSAEKRAVVRKDAIVSRTIMSLTLSADHRAVDGVAAAEFLRTLKALLEEPAMMLA